MARDFDTLSDLLCRVIDVSDFTRVFHRDAAMMKAARETYEDMFEYMNSLNVNTGLNQQLKKALDMPEVRSSWCEEEIMAAQTLVRDFAHSAIDQPLEKRQDFVDLSNKISQAGTEFVTQMEPAKRYVSVATTSLPPEHRPRKLSWRNPARTMLPIHENTTDQILRLVEDGDTRREVFTTARQASKKQIGRAEKLLLLRAALAKLTGFSSYAQMILSHKSALAKTPKGVNNFLTALNASNRSRLKPQIDQLLALKRESDPGAQTLQPWDVSFYRDALRSREKARSLGVHQTRWNPEYFSLGTVIAGLSRLIQRLYGVRLVPRPVAPTEVWNPDVRRLDVVSETEGHVAVVYCDLFARLGKPPNPAHFTLRCSREITAEEIDAAASLPEEEVNDGMPTRTAVSSISGKPALHQLPVIALMCDFENGAAGKSTPALLSLNNVSTLFHEMGHAMHSIQGRTSLQTIAGTRCAADFAELPSILMEYFALNPAVLRLYARHWQSGVRISESQANALHDQHHLHHSGREASWQNETQILMSVLDQSLHSEAPLEALDNHDHRPAPPFDSTSIYHAVWNTHGSLPEPVTTSWQALFGHLYSYGGTYYSYLFDRAIARQVWRLVFHDGVPDGAALDRAAGDRLDSQLLRHGGGRDPWRCLEDLIGEGKGVLAEGGEEAMLEVGKWGVGVGVGAGAGDSTAIVD